MKVEHQSGGIDVRDAGGLQVHPEHLGALSGRQRKDVHSGGLGRNEGGQVVRQVNGTPVRNLRHLVETLRDAKGPFVEIEFHEKSAETLVFVRQEVLAAMEDILSDNNIGKQWSDNELRKAWLAEK